MLIMCVVPGKAFPETFRMESGIFSVPEAASDPIVHQKKEAELQVSPQEVAEASIYEHACDQKWLSTSK